MVIWLFKVCVQDIKKYCGNVNNQNAQWFVHHLVVDFGDWYGHAYYLSLIRAPTWVTTNRQPRATCTTPGFDLGTQNRMVDNSASSPSSTRKKILNLARDCGSKHKELNSWLVYSETSRTHARNGRIRSLASVYYGKISIASLSVEGFRVLTESLYLHVILEMPFAKTQLKSQFCLLLGGFVFFSLNMKALCSSNFASFAP